MARHSYAFRPAKHIQRLMIVDACRRLRAISLLQNYEYVGFGGFEFVDFDLIRRSLGIDQMISYEKDSAQERYSFNQPFGGVTIKFGPASSHLPFLDRATLRIVWLDYLQKLDAEVLQDIETAAELLAPGSVLIVTVNAMPARPAERRREELAECVGEERIPVGVDDGSLAQWGLAQVQRRIARSAIDNALGRRGDASTFEQLFHFHYADGAQMLTYGGVVLIPAAQEAFAAAKFNELEQVSTDEVARRIVVPSLTAREAIHLNRQLPTDDPAALDAPGLTESEKGAYAELYRWYPPVPTPI